MCGAAHWGGDLRAGEKVRERAGVARRISRPGDSTGLFEQQVPVKSVFAQKIGTLDKRRRRYGRAGVHTEHALKQTRRQRIGVEVRRAPWRRRARGTARRQRECAVSTLGVEEKVIARERA